MRRLLLLLGLLAAAIGIAACGDDEGSGSSDDALVVYSGRNQDLVGDLLKQFESETGQQLEVRYSNSADLAATLLEEGDNSPADVFFSQDAGALGALQKDGRLAKLPATILDEVDKRYQSTEGVWIGLSARARVIAYDKRELEPADLPKSVLDLVDDKWEGRIGWTPTNPSFETFVTALRKLEGDDAAKEWLEGMVSNDTKPFDNNIAVRDAIANGEVDLGLINHYYVAEAVAAEGTDYPVGVFFPPAGDPGSLINVAGGAVLKSSDKQAQAQQFLSFLLSEKGQKYFADKTKEYPIAAGVRPDPALAPLSSIHSPEIDLSDLDDLQGSVEMIRDSGAL